jgi:peptidoglycan hydrolase CwlO-like protein
MSEPCFTHHNDCDCMEAAFKSLVAKNARLSAKVKSLKSEIKELESIIAWRAEWGWQQKHLKKGGE